MQAAVLATRLRRTIRESSIWEFEAVYHIIDAECVLATLRNNTSALGEWWGNRVQECLNSTEIMQWSHVRSKQNIDDLGTRANATVEDINEQSEWQNGISWMYLPRKDWPVTQDIEGVVPEEALVRRHISAHAAMVESVIPYSKHTGKSYSSILATRINSKSKSKSFSLTQKT